MNDTELLFYNLLKQIAEDLHNINNKLCDINEEIGNIKRRM